MYGIPQAVLSSVFEADGGREALQSCDFSPESGVSSTRNGWYATTEGLSVSRGRMVGVVRSDRRGGGPRRRVVAGADDRC